ncbi:DUF695 domain-containing protein [Chryseomicrobium imtechense]
MEDRWIGYESMKFEVPVTVVMVDGLVEDGLHHAYPYAMKILLTLQQPNEHGLPELPELDSLNDQEEPFLDVWEKQGFLYAGRLTGNGERSIILYGKSESQLAELQSTAEQAFSNYSLEVTRLEEQSPWDYYLEVLVPDVFEIQVMNDYELLGQLEENKDSGEVVRRVDHWSYFPTSEAAKAYQEYLEDKGFMIEEVAEQPDEDGVYLVQFFKDDQPIEISDTTLPLLQKALELDGDYDGWETAVIAKKSRFLNFLRRN